MQSPERFVEKVALSLGANLRSAVLYGSAAAQDVTRRYSDVNLLLVVGQADADTLGRIAAPTRDWVAGGQPAPLVVAADEIERSQDVFPIEFSDIRDRHLVLHGDAGWIAGLSIRPADLRWQLESELRSKLLHLRQAFLAAAGDPAAEERAAARALSAAAALFRATLRLTGDPVPASTVEAIRAVQARIPVDGDAWEMVWRLRQGERPPAAANLFPRLIAGLQALIRFVDAHAAS